MLEQVIEAINTRHSVRAYLDRAVPGEVLENIIKVAMRSPSWGNTQPWEIAVASGEVLAEIRREIKAAADALRPPEPDFPFPASWPPANQQRYSENGERMYQILNIDRNDAGAREKFAQMGLGFFNAPVVIFLFMDGGLSPWSLFDMGLFTQTLLVAAHAHGLGACPMARAVIYPGLVKKALKIPDNKKLVLGIPVGYADGEAKINGHRSTRVSMDEAVRWHS